MHILGTVHADTVEELWEKPYLRQGIKKGIFERFILIRDCDQSTGVSGL